jgi:fatty acid-binding protein DegV
MQDGQLKKKKTYSGNLKHSFESYVNDLAAEYSSYDKSLCFITHCKAEPEYVEMVKVKVKEMFDFENIVVSEAGSTVSAHCGRNTLGVLFITADSSDTESN